ncbi:unnamed protein product, partial [Larinioides sclopetarius]
HTKCNSSLSCIFFIILIFTLYSIYGITKEHLLYLQFRMKNSCLKNPIYLVENCSGAKYLGLPESTLEQAMINTQICDGFLVKRTQGVKESVTYLNMMTKMLRRKYQNLTLISGSKEAVQKKTISSNIFMSFKEFNCSSVKNKNLTVKEMFAKHLLQFFGLSVDRAAAIVDVFKTPSEFIDALEKCSSENEKVQLISSIKYGLHKNCHVERCSTLLIRRLKLVSGSTKQETSHR